MKIVAFEFQLLTPQGLRWARVQGSGGLVGNGSLHAWQDGRPPNARQIRIKLLRRVRAMLENGPLIVARDEISPIGEEFEKVSALAVLRTREIKDRKKHEAGR
jgi:hypothetical protein